MSIPIPKVMSWPLEGVNEQGRLAYAEDDLSVQQVIRNILLTRPGERVMRPQFGAGLMDFIHQPNTTTTRNLMASTIQKAIEQWETRVLVDAVDVRPDNASLSAVQVTIRYQMRFSGQPAQLSFGLDLSQL